MIRIRVDRRTGYDQYEVYVLRNKHYLRSWRWRKTGCPTGGSLFVVGARAEMQVLPAWTAFAHIEPLFVVSGPTMRKHKRLWRLLRRLDRRADDGVQAASDHFRKVWYDYS